MVIIVIIVSFDGDLLWVGKDFRCSYMGVRGLQC